MNKTRPPQRPADRIPLERTPTGVSGIDEIMEGGLPKGRSTLLRGEGGSGKTRRAVEPHTRTPRERPPTGVSGIDEIMEGGLPKGRSTLLRGEAGSGKTLLAVEEITGNCQMLPRSEERQVG